MTCHDTERGPGLDTDCSSGCGPRFRPGFGPGRFMRQEHRHMRGSGCMPGHGHIHGGGGRSFERGGIKFAVLELLKDKPRHGYDIIRDMEERSGGVYSPSPGAIYPTLQALEDQDLVVPATEEGKKVYTITDAGLAYLEEHKERAKSHRERWESQWGSGPHGENWSAIAGIRDTMSEVWGAVRRTAGDPGRLKEIGQVLEEAAEKIRAIMKR